MKLFLQASFVLKGVRLPLIKKRQNLKKPPIKLYQWHPPEIDNFGDLVSEHIILNLLGFSSVWAPLEDCDLIAAGSILELAGQANRTYPLYAWGSGFIREDSKDTPINKIIFKAVRGKKTEARVHTKNIPTGDPAILVNAAFLLKKKRHSQKVGVVIHYADFETKFAKRLKNDSRFEIISPLEPPQVVAQKISKCGLILSSSLHGLIFADSLSIPNAHIKISDNLTGGTYKFLDYYSGVGKKYIPADIEKIFDDNYLRSLKKAYQPIPHLARKQRKLLKAFPF